MEDWQVDMCAPGQTQVGRCVLPSIVLARALVSHNSVNVSYREQVTEASFYLNIQLKCQSYLKNYHCIHFLKEMLGLAKTAGRQRAGLG